MTHPLKSLRTLILPAAAISISVLGLAAGSNAGSNSNSASDLPLNCEIAVSKGRYGHTYEAVVHANKAVRGTYALSISKRSGGGSAMISQSGDFALAAGKSDTVGQATFGGTPPSAINAELTIRFNGQTMTCSNHTDI